MEPIFVGLIFFWLSLLLIFCLLIFFCCVLHSILYLCPGVSLTVIHNFFSPRLSSKSMNTKTLCGTLLFFHQRSVNLLESLHGDSHSKQFPTLNWFQTFIFLQGLLVVMSQRNSQISGQLAQVELLLNWFFFFFSFLSVSFLFTLRQNKWKNK